MELSIIPRTIPDSFCFAVSDFVIRHSSFFSPSMPFQPEGAVPRPGMPIATAVRNAAEADAMRPLLIHMQVERHARLAQSRGKLKAVLHRYGWVLVRVPNKTRRCVFSHLQLV